MKTFYMAVGTDYCFHNGNRVAICERDRDGEEVTDSTVAEVWPVEAGSDVDVKQGREILMGLRAGSALLAALKEAEWRLDHLSGCCAREEYGWDKADDAALAAIRAAIALAEMPDDPEEEISGMQEG